ncbi:hypothetical protein A2U01_0058945, partial [Trifolium medium]|nr:hypothetical protein [Trifolium medium]
MRFYKAWVLYLKESTGTEYVSGTGMYLVHH